jgi:hypothetical protein
MSTAYRDVSGDDVRNAFVDSLEENHAHTYPFEKWLRLLSRIPAYRDPRPVPRPCLRVINYERRERLMTWRVQNGYKPIHPQDSWVEEFDLSGGFVLRNGRNGATYQGEGVTNG